MWRAKDVVAVIFALTVPLVLLFSLVVRMFGPGLSIEGLVVLKEIVLVVTGGLIMWLGGEDK